MTDTQEGPGSALVTINRTEIDGVPVLWADTGPGAFVGSLQFAVGRSDEPPAAGGITHLVEHLALARFGQQDFGHSGMVDSVRTVFHARGTPDEVSGFLGALAGSLQALPDGRLPLERRILQDEANQAGPSFAAPLLWYRFGSAGYGQAGVDELGLTWLGPERVRSWSAERFTRGAAGAWFSGPPPAGLRLDLPDGPPHPRPPLAAIPDVELPAHVPWTGNGVAIGYLAERSSASNIAARILERRARQRLRFDRGLVYDVVRDYEPLTGDVAHVILGADCPEDRVDALRTALLEVIDELATIGPTSEELAADLGAFDRGFEDRDNRLGYLDAQLSDLLIGQPIIQSAELRERRAAATPADVRDAFAAGAQTGILLAAGAPADSPWHEYPAWSNLGLTGREYRPSGFRLPGRGPKARLVVGPEGLMLTMPEGRLTVRWRDAVAVVHERPTVRTVLGGDGFRVVVAAEAWKDGAQAVAAIDAHAPAEVVACGQHGIGGHEERGPG